MENSLSKLTVEILDNIHTSMDMEKHYSNDINFKNELEKAIDNVVKEKATTSIEKVWNGFTDKQLESIKMKYDLKNVLDRFEDLQRIIAHNENAKDMIMSSFNNDYCKLNTRLSKEERDSILNMLNEKVNKMEKNMLKFYEMCKEDNLI